MIDREKVAKEFVHLLNAAKGNYQDFVDLTVDFGEEIAALLKEQEPKLVKIDGDGVVLCPSCGNELFTYPQQKFCDECGQAVKWK